MVLIWFHQHGVCSGAASAAGRQLVWHCISAQLQFSPFQAASRASGGLSWATSVQPDCMYVAGTMQRTASCFCTLYAEFEVVSRLRAC